MNDDGKSAWDQQDGETDKAYKAFCAYLLLGSDRSIDATWRDQTGRKEVSCKRAPGYFREWSTRWNWTSRASEFDQYSAQQALAKRQDTLDQLVVVAEETTLLTLQEIKRRLTPGEKAVPLELGEVTKALNATTNAIHRLQSITGQGKPDPITSVSVTVDLYDTDTEREVPEEKLDDAR